MRLSSLFILLVMAFTLCLSCRSPAPPTNKSAAPGQLPAPASGPASINSRDLPSSLAEELKQMKQAGLPTAPQELQAPLPPEARNAAPIYLKLVVLIKEKPAVGDDLAATGGVGRRPLTAEQATKLRRALEHRTDISQLIYQALERPDCVFERNWSQGASLMFPEFARLRMAARWLSAESALRLYDGKPLDAIQTQALGFRLARQTANDPMLIAYLVALAIDAITIAGMERILYAAGDKPGVAQAIQKVLETEWQPHSLAHALHSEIIFPIVEVDKNRKVSPDAYEKDLETTWKKDGLTVPIPRLTGQDKQHWDQFVDRSEIAMLHNLETLIAAADKPYQEAIQIVHGVDADLKAHEPDPAYVMAQILSPVYAQAFDKHAQNLAKAATLKAATAIFLWKDQHGTFPDKLEGALPTVFLDPFDGKRLHYHKEGSGFVIYSIGPTGMFDGGTPDKKPEAMESLFRYPMPTYLN